MLRFQRLENLQLLETFRGPITTGRWLLVGAETLETAFVLAGGGAGPSALLCLGILAAYNAVSLAVLHLVPIRRIPVSLAVLMDLAMIGLAAHHTGGVESPFLPLCYLVLFAAALFFGMLGGLLTGVACALLAALLALPRQEHLLAALRDPIPYFVITGTFAGYLVGSIRLWFRRYRQSVAEARDRAVREEAEKRELELAHAVQQATLPLGPPRVPGLDVAFRSEFAREVGGDFLLFVPGKDRLAVALGDVTGKGFSAALSATSIQHLLPWLRPLEDPAGALRRLNTDLEERLPRGAFATLALAILEPSRDRVSVWSAGHPPGLLWSAEDGELGESRASGPLLGVFPSWDGTADTWPLQAEDVLLLYTDGLVEARAQTGEEFGLERVREVLEGVTDCTPDEIADALLDAVHAWCDPTDDLTLVVCKRAVQAPVGAGERAAPLPTFAPA